MNTYVSIMICDAQIIQNTFFEFHLSHWLTVRIYINSKRTLEAIGLGNSFLLFLTDFMRLYLNNVLPELPPLYIFNVYHTQYTYTTYYKHAFRTNADFCVSPKCNNFTFICHSFKAGISISWRKLLATKRTILL